MTQFSAEDVGSMLAALAIYHIGMTDLVFRPDEKESEVLRNKTLEFISEVLGPRIIARVDQIEAELRQRAEERNSNG